MYQNILKTSNKGIEMSQVKSFERSLFWDNYKGILILLVVFGHCIYSYALNLEESLAHEIYMLIYSFHMPAFIMCSGYFSKSERARSHAALVQMLLYYLVFNTCMALFAYFYMGTGIKFLSPYYSYWYIVSMIIWRIVIGDLGKIKGIIPISLLAALLIGYNSEFTNIFSVRRTIAFFCFFVAGYLLDKEKVETFLAKRSTYSMVFCGIMGGMLSVVICKMIKYMKITDSMTMMGRYHNNTDILCRIMIFLIAIAAIAILFCVIPNRKIPLLTKFGRNSLLIYLAHRMFTIIYYTEIFPRESYENIYIVYAGIAAILICMIFSSEKLNYVFMMVFNKATTAVIDHNSVAGRRIKLLAIVTVLFLFALDAKDVIIEFMP